jgi:hypothetical protein
MYAAPVITSLINQHDSLSSVDRSRWDVLAVDNAFFGGNTAVAGLMVGDDIRRVVQQHEDIFEDTKTLYLLPDVCLSEGKFLDGTTLDQLSGRIHVVPTDGHALRRILERTLL